MATWTGGALMHRLARGDPQALEDLYDRYAGIVNALVLRIVPDAEAADEVLQAVFLQAWREADINQGSEGTLIAWLGTIARARALERLDAWERANRVRARRSRVALAAQIGSPRGPAGGQATKLDVC